MTINSSILFTILLSFCLLGISRAEEQSNGYLSIWMILFIAWIMMFMVISGISAAYLWKLSNDLEKKTHKDMKFMKSTL